MSSTKLLTFSVSKSPPLILQTEIAECGLASLAQNNECEGIFFDTCHSIKDDGSKGNRVKCP